MIVKNVTGKALILSVEEREQRLLIQVENRNERRETTNEYNPLEPYTGNDVAAQERALSYTFFAALSATHGHPLCIGAIGIMDYISAWSVDLYTRLSQSLLGQPLLSCVHG